MSNHARPRGGNVDSECEQSKAGRDSLVHARPLKSAGTFGCGELCKESGASAWLPPSEESENLEHANPNKGINSLAQTVLWENSGALRCRKSGATAAGSVQGMLWKDKAKAKCTDPNVSSSIPKQPPPNRNKTESKYAWLCENNVNPAIEKSSAGRSGSKQTSLNTNSALLDHPALRNANEAPHPAQSSIDDNAPDLCIPNTATGAPARTSDRNASALPVDPNLTAGNTRSEHTGLRNARELLACEQPSVKSDELEHATLNAIASTLG